MHLSYRGINFTFIYTINVTSTFKSYTCFSEMAYKCEKIWREERSKEREEFLFSFSIDIFWQILKLVYSEILKSVCSGKI